MSKITPFLWFDGQAEAAANFYVSVFEGSKLLDVSRYGEGASLPWFERYTEAFDPATGLGGIEIWLPLAE